jgi:glycosyltransferase involved in cell wall biosynthesis
MDFFLPAFKTGGPIRSVSGLVDRLGDQFRFKIVARDRDFGDEAPFPGVAVNAWQRHGKAEVFYASPEFPSLHNWRNLLYSTPHDVLYLNSIFSRFTPKLLLLRRLGLLPGKPVIIAPRGEFSRGALTVKARKKQVYLALSKAGGFYSDIIWHATGAFEADDIRREIGGQTESEVDVRIASNVPSVAEVSRRRASESGKLPGRLEIAFISRIARKKNLDGALRMLARISGDVRMNVYGHLEDQGYWAECRALIGELPRNVQVTYHGPIEHSRVPQTLSEHDLFLLPTLGENFGHVILEALASGCPVLISDQTAWRNLEEAGVGWDLPLDEVGRFQDVLQACADMDANEHARLSEAAGNYAANAIHNSNATAESRQLFGSVASDADSPGAAGTYSS